MPVLIDFLIIVVLYLDTIINDVYYYAEWTVARFIGLINYLEKCHCQGASI